MPDLNLLIFPLLGSYFFLSRTNYFKIRQQLLDRQRLIFTILLYALCFLTLSFIVASLIKEWFPLFSYKILLLIPIKQKWVGTCLLSFILALFSSLVLNLWYKESKSFVKAVLKYGNDLHKLLLSAFTNRELLMVSLKNNKVYIGFIDYLPKSNDFNFLYFKITPIVSGYRLDTNHSLEITTNYFKAYENYHILSENEDFSEDAFDNLDKIEVIIKTDELVSASLFNIELYQQFNSDEEADGEGDDTE
ncbi:MAG: hypothetical protein AAF620_13580 [Bacteroidota bacterium]